MRRSARSPEFLSPRTFGDLSGAVLQGCYQVNATLQRGVNFTLYEAQHLRLARKVVLKCPNPRLLSDTQALAEFRREVELLSSLVHPHVVAVHDFDETTEGHPYLVLEHLSGRTLLQHLAEKRKFAPALALRVVTQIGSALTVAHAQGVVHGGLTPESVFLVEEGNDVFAKMLGFDASAQGRIPPFEDQHSLAELLYAMLTSRPVTGPFPSRRDLPPSLIEVVLRGLHPQAWERYPTVLEFCEALRAAAGLVSYGSELAEPRHSQVRHSSRVTWPPGAPDPAAYGAPTIDAVAEPSLEESLRRNVSNARREALSGNLPLAVSLLRGVVEELDGTGRDVPASQLLKEQCVGVLRAVLRERCGSSRARVLTGQSLTRRAMQYELSSEEAHLLYLAGEEMTLEDLVDLSGLPSHKAWLFVAQLVTQGLIRTA